jgi:predicted DNA-binding transcriptional regulator AlpA
MVEDDELIGIGAVRKLLGDCSDMHVWRLCNSPRYEHLDFPKPVKLDERPNARNYWWRGQIVTWVKRRLQATVKLAQPAALPTTHP